jgi:nitroimidazol reductase NimA-like FMN-containing flavoprotein (pyridoxamine 5'-phosphate oxidase superfamily)
MIEMTADEIEQLLASSLIGRLAMADTDGTPYVIPMPFCWVAGELYLRLPKKGRKWEILQRNHRVCFEVDSFNEELTEYASALIEGELTAVHDLDEKLRVKHVNDEKYLRLRKGHRPGHGRVSRLADLPLQKVVPIQISGRKKEPELAAIIL